MTDSPILIVGLGNPGPKYADTRHNIGVRVLEELADRVRPMPASLTVHKRSNTEIAELPAGRLGARKVVLARTRSFMNLSGGPVKALATYFAVAPADVIVIHDELELDFGVVRLRTGGGDHGHNGLKSVTKSLGTKDYQRLAIGIGRPPGRMDPAGFVLKPFTRTEQSELPFICSDAADEIERGL
ncbi:aminoacyl-tRNA hydrolase [Corynebacterium halotolerans]|uniref:Peptidyl-tRNA hydrolase n=1 Tax=Corynebacterium halotolerans YIM 70093 = DSM 44683 TaxID=1121362 RepID=M1P5N4_9CORY|nr:aminoacyl-tRNA hydrolase [Corynebacterium halotolerans]AGF71956.1 peptidyl-tRNA hydrolase [Corynebacterium halotolerans YIM 70093 = DSM 44683]